jgi:signal transduction histidine kinase
MPGLSILDRSISTQSQIAEEHGGVIIIKSEQGKGTEVVLTLPVYRGEGE